MRRITSGRCLKTLILSCLLLPALSLASPAEELRTRLASFDALRAAFTQTVTDEQDTLLNEAQGLLQLQKPKRILVHTMEPDETFLFTRADGLYFYDPFINQVTIMDSGVLDTSPFALLISSDPSLWERYAIAGEDGSYTLTVRAPSEGSGALNKLTLTFDGESLSSLSLFMQDGTVNSYTFSGVTTEIRAEDFEVVLPPDVEVDDGR